MSQGDLIGFRSGTFGDKVDALYHVSWATPEQFFWGGRACSELFCWGTLPPGSAWMSGAGQVAFKRMPGPKVSQQHNNEMIN